MKSFIALFFALSVMWASSRDTNDIMPVIRDYAAKDCRIAVSKIDVAVDAIRVDGDYVGFSGAYTTVEGLKDPDIYCEEALTLCLHKIDGRWKIVFDLSGGDVPTDEEMRQIVRDFPTDFPLKLLSSFWQKKFTEVRRHKTKR